MANTRNSMVEVLPETEIRNYIRAAVERINDTKPSVITALDVLDRDWGVVASEKEVRRVINTLRR